MAKQPIDIGVKITADSTVFEKAAANVGKSTKAIKKDIKDTAGVFNELGGAIGGIGGDVTSMVSQLATAGGPIALLTAAISGIAMAWKRSQENVELYLKSADKVKFGFAGYNVDAEAARTDTRRRAMGQITSGRASLTEANRILGFAGSTAGEKEMARIMKEEAISMINAGIALRAQVMGIKDKITWDLKYNKLLQEQETLNDTSLENAVKWESLEAELIRQKTIIQDKDTKAKDKAVAIVEAERIAAQLLKEKNIFIDKQLTNTNALSKMTATEEVVENRVWELQKQKANNLKEYGADMLKVLKMETKITSETGKQLAIQKDFNTHTEAGFKLDPILAGKKGIRGIGFRSGKTTEGAPGIQPFGGLTQKEIDAIKKETIELEKEQMVVENLTGVFENMFASIDDGIKGMADSLVQSIKRIAAELAAKAVLFALISILIPGGTTVAGGFKAFMGFGASLGSGGGGNINGGPMVRLQGDLRGHDIYLAGARYGNMLNGTT